MAEEKTIDNPEYDDEGKPIIEEGVDESGDESTTEKNGSEEDDGGEEDFGNDDDDVVVPTRGFNASQIIARKNKTIEKLRSEQEEDDSDDDSKLTPEANEAIDSKVKPILDVLKKTADEGEIKDLLSSNPDAKKYEKRIRAYMEHPNYQGVPAEVIFHHLAFKTGDSSTETEKKKSIADTEANQNKGAGSSKRPHRKGSGDIPDVSNMSDDDFEALQDKALQGGFIK